MCWHSHFILGAKGEKPLFLSNACVMDRTIKRIYINQVIRCFTITYYLTILKTSVKFKFCFNITYMNFYNIAEQKNEMKEIFNCSYKPGTKLEICTKHELFFWISYSSLKENLLTKIWSIWLKLSICLNLCCPIW